MEWNGRKLGRVVALLILGLCLLLAACGPDSAATATPRPGFDPAETSKIDTLLRDLLAQYQIGGLPAARTYARDKGLLDDQDRVRFGLTLTGPNAAPGITTRLQQMGGEVYQSYGTQLAVAVNLTKLTSYVSNNTEKRDFLTELAALSEVRELKVLLRPALDWAGLTSPNSVGGDCALNFPATFASLPNEGVAIIGADKWQTAGFNGRGIKVGIIDGGFKGYRTGLGSSLPSATQVTFRSFILGNSEGNEPHGVAVAELVHSLAPEASLYLAPIEDEIGFSQAVDWLLDNKVQIIQASLGWGGLFPGDGTGKMDEQLDRARRLGVLPVVSVGNYGRAHYSALLNTNPDSLQRFGSNSSNRVTLKLTAEAGSAWVALRWDEKWEHPPTNLDLTLLNSAGQAIASSRNEQGSNSPKPPTELIPFQATPGQSYFVQVRLVGKPPATPPRLHLFTYNATLEENTPEGSVSTPGDARGALSVGAVNWRDDKLESYSSRGPTIDGRLKPELTGPSRVSTQTYGREGAFTGTSASAPQVSGTAALLWSAAPGLTAEQVAQYLIRNALRPDGTTATVLRDPASGYGRVRLGPAEEAKRGPVELLGALPIGAPFQDDFAANSSGLPDNTQGYYGKLPESLNAYFIRVNEPGVLSWSSYLQKSFDEFRADFEAAPLSADPKIFYGLTFWQQAAQEYYAFLVSGDRYALLKRKGSEWTTLIDWTRHAALNPTPDPTKRQRLSVEATAQYIRLRVGETVLQSIALKDARPGGRLGFAAGVFSNNGSQPAIENGTIFGMFSKLSVTPLTTR